MITASEFLKWLAIFGIQSGGGGGGGFIIQPACVVGTIGVNLNATYNNGTAGVGATLTNAGTLAAFSLDGIAPPLNSRVLVKDQTLPARNGIYSLTTVGDGSTPWVLTRATNYDTPAEIQPGDLVPILEGTINANSSWLQYDTVTTIGTDPIQFNLFTANPNAFFKVVNNLNESTNTPVLRNNIGANAAVINVASAGTTTLTNPPSTYVQTSPSVGNISLNLPFANETDAGFKSLQVGEFMFVTNEDDTNITQVYCHDGSTLVTRLNPGQFALVVPVDNSTTNGAFLVKRFGTAYQMNASDISSTSILSAALNPNIAWIGQIPVFADENGSIVSSGYVPGEFPLLTQTITTSHALVAGDLGSVFVVTVSGIDFSASAVASYIGGYWFTIKNESSGAITFTPNAGAGDTVEGAPSLTINPGESYSFSKSTVAHSWICVWNFNTAAASGYFAIANNLSESLNFPTLRNNIGFISNYQAITVNTILSNPCPNIIYVTAPSGNITLAMPPMNSTTPGSKSPALGQIIRIVNISSHNATLYFNDNVTPLPIAVNPVPPGVTVDLEVVQIGSVNGFFNANIFNTGCPIPASNAGASFLTSVTSPSSGWINQVSVFTDASGSIGTSGYVIGQFPLLTQQVITSIGITNSNIAQAFIATVSGINFTVTAVSGYTNGFWFVIKNESSGAVTFTPNAGDTFEGSSSLTINTNESYTIVKSVVANTWVAVANYNTASASGYFAIANNLSESTNTPVLRNNIGANARILPVNTPGTTSLTNPPPSYLVSTPTGGDITLNLPVANSVTPGSKSMQAGEFMIITNEDTTNSTSVFLSDGSTPLTEMSAGQFAIVIPADNSTSLGSFYVKKFGTAYQMNASSILSSSILSAALNPDIAWVDQLPVFADENGSLTVLTGTANQVLALDGMGKPVYTSSLTGLTINNSSIGATTPADGTFTLLTVTGTTQLGNILNVNQTITLGTPLLNAQLQLFGNSGLLATIDNNAAVNGSLTFHLPPLTSGSSTLLDTVTAQTLTNKTIYDNTSYVSTATTLTSSQTFVPFDTSGGAFTIKLPASPATGETHALVDDTGNAGTNNLTIDGNGKNIDGEATTVINTDFGGLIAKYNGTQWNVIANTGGGTPVPGINFEYVTTATKQLSPNTTYYTIYNGNCVFTLPVHMKPGQYINIIASGSTTWTIAQNSGQTIFYGINTSTTGTSGSFNSTSVALPATLTCFVEDEQWAVTGTVFTDYTLV